MARTPVLLAVLISGVATKTFAWDDFGHMVVADVTYRQLPDSTKTRISRLLKLNPSYAAWVTSVPASNRDEVAFVKAATWPDAIKRDSTYKNDGEHPSGRDASRNVGYSDKLLHKYWHYIDLPFSPDGTPLAQPVAPNAQTQIHEFRKTIASSFVSDDVKSYDLVWLLHLVGDVHQPLHATSRFDKQQPHGDSGGNLVGICEAQSCDQELHAFWDEALGKDEPAEAAITYAASLAPADPKLAAMTDERKWVEESFEIATTSVYVPPIGVGPGPFAIDDKYKTAAHDIATKRVALAGARLAGVLKEAFADVTPASTSASTKNGCADRHGGALVSFQMTCGAPSKTQALTIWTTNAKFINEARGLLASGKRRVPTLDLLDGPDCDRNWSWHTNPATTAFSAVTTEVCDGCPKDVESNKDHWLTTVKRLCPWSAVVTGVRSQ